MRVYTRAQRFSIVRFARQASLTRLWVNSKWLTIGREELMEQACLKSEKQ